MLNLKNDIILNLFILLIHLKREQTKKNSKTAKKTTDRKRDKDEDNL